MCTHLSCRRMERGTYGRSAAANQGRSRRQPRPGRRAKTRCITRDPGKSARVFETGGSGCSSDDGRDNITLPEQRPRGPRWPFEWPEAESADNAGRMAGGHETGEGRVKPAVAQVYADLALKPEVVDHNGSNLRGLEYRVTGSVTRVALDSVSLHDLSASGKGPADR